jgi:hypothetical protein
MHRLNFKTPSAPSGTMPPPGERAAATQKAARDAPNKRAQEEAHRMGDALAYAKKKETLSIK